MGAIHTLEEDVRSLYATKNPLRADWADWLGEHHVFVVADNADNLAKLFGANPVLARAAALLHDIADTKMSRFAEGHEEVSLTIARELMEQAGFRATDIQLVVDDAIRYHSCRNGQVPSSLEGKVLAAADSLAHLQTDFYIFATWMMGQEKTLEDTKAWVRKKLDRDFNDKILFNEIKAECRIDYERLKATFER